jgi:hypothetical protein
MIATPEHAELNAELNAYLDGELERARRAQVEAHVQACAACAQDLAQLAQTRTALRAVPPLRAPRPFTLSLDSDTPAPVHAARPRVSRWAGLFAWGWRLGSLASAACVVVAALAAGGAPVPAATQRDRLATAPQVAPAPPAQGSAALADRNASQRVAPQATALPAGSAGMTGIAAAQTPAEAALGATSRGPATPGAGGTPVGAAADAAAPGAGAAAQQSAAQPAATQPATGEPAARFAPGAPNQGTQNEAAPGFGAGSAETGSAEAQKQTGAPAATPAGLPPAAPWTAAAAALGLGSAVLFALERRARHLAGAGRTGPPG